MTIDDHNASRQTETDADLGPTRKTYPVWASAVTLFALLSVAYVG